MPKRFPKLIAGLLVMALCLSPISAFAVDDTEIYVFKREPQGQGMAGDIAIIRPISIGCLIVSTGAYLVALPFAALGGNAEETTQKMVVEPFNYTFRRPLGDF
ncbi:MAG: hypothetical protein QNJ48_09290 [Desulfobacterales bacterium]|nr:hypothetical protein [Desulfobacterales bacterium]MDJ0884347.1 hypothetical protein [Desulfobacterales bacterium]